MDASGVASGMKTLSSSTRNYYFGSHVVDGGIALGGTSILKIDHICFNATVFL